MTAKTYTITNKIRDELTNTVIESMENSIIWQSGINSCSNMPMNVKGNYYNGINILLLWIQASKHGYLSPKWLTYKQAQSKGGNVIKGERGTKIIFYKTLEIENKSGDDSKTIPMLKQYTVFNSAQIEGIDFDSITATEWQDIESGELLAKYPICPIKTADKTPCYNSLKDTITIPSKQKFKTSENYYATLAHELAHSTGHKTRLDRLDKVSPNDNLRGYAFEELIAELSAVFTTRIMGIEGNTENHASYIKSWLKAMKSDNKYIFEAASKASKATQTVLNNINTQLKEV